MEKQCRACLITKPIDQFWPQRNGWLGVRSKCKDCLRAQHRIYQAKRMAEDPEYRARKSAQSMSWAAANPEKRSVIAKRRNTKEKARNPAAVTARALVNQRVRFGRIPRAKDLNCSYCGNAAHHYHHHLGYAFENRYDVIPLCRKCHKAADKASSHFQDIDV